MNKLHFTSFKNSCKYISNPKLLNGSLHSLTFVTGGGASKIKTYWSSPNLNIVEEEVWCKYSGIVVYMNMVINLYHNIYQSTIALPSVPWHCHFIYLFIFVRSVRWMHTCRKEMMRIQCPLPPHRRRVLLHPLSGRRALPWHHFSFDNLLTFQTNDRVKELGWWWKGDLAPECRPRSGDDCKRLSLEQR